MGKVDWRFVTAAALAICCAAGAAHMFRFGVYPEGRPGIALISDRWTGNIYRCFLNNGCQFVFNKYTGDAISPLDGMTLDLPSPNVTSQSQPPTTRVDPPTRR